MASKQHPPSKSETTISARVFDPAPPSYMAIVLAAVFVLGILCIGLTEGLSAIMSFAAIVLALIWDSRRRRPGRMRRIVCKPGSLAIRGSGRIRVRDLEGATTARHGDRISLVLTHRRRKRAPIVIDLPDEPSLMTICKSLGIGHHGFGYVDFVAQPPNAARLRYVPNIATILALGMVWISALSAPAFLLLFVAGGTAGLCMIARLTALPKVIRLTSNGVFIPGLFRADFLPFSAIDEVTLEHDAVVFRIESKSGTLVKRVPITPTSWTPQGASREELSHFVAQIRAASERAHGKFLLKARPETLAEQLERGASESINEWHARLDTLGVGGGGYRSTTLEPRDLWTLFEDPDAPANVRAGAARILKRIDRDEIRVRVADVLATVRDESTRARIAASIDEADAEEEAERAHSAHS